MLEGNSLFAFVSFWVFVTFFGQSYVFGYSWTWNFPLTSPKRDLIFPFVGFSIHSANVLFTCRRSTEISLVIRQTMEACIMTHLMPRSQVTMLSLDTLSAWVGTPLFGFWNFIYLVYRLIFLSKFSRRMEVTCELNHEIHSLLIISFSYISNFVSDGVPLCSVFIHFVLTASLVLLWYIPLMIRPINIDVKKCSSVTLPWFGLSFV